jgi:hypothetical protein
VILFAQEQSERLHFRGIWTALGPRFEKEAGERFSVDATIRYLLTLPMPTRTRALEYIRNAPEEVVTPVRKGVYAAFGI